MKTSTDKKNRIVATASLLLLSILLIGITQGATAQYNNDGYGNNYDDGYNNNNNDYMSFYNEMQPYGQWFRDPRYGMVWAPNAGSDFVPYQTNGYWTMTQYGNTWMSNYSWGWAAFHYGRWVFDQYYGWLWMPGREWGPAWVSWRQGGGYYGWAPMGPGMTVGMSFGYNSGFNCWTFIPQGYLYNRGGYNRYNRHSNNHNIYNQTNNINNYDRQSGRNYVVGPSRGDVESAVRRPVTVYRLNDQPNRGTSNVRGNEINMYRPDVSRAVSNQARPDVSRVKVISINRADRTTSSTTPSRVSNNSVNTSNGNRVQSSNAQGRTTVQPNRIETVDRVSPTRATTPAAPASQTTRSVEVNRTQQSPSNNRTSTPATTPTRVQQSSPSRTVERTSTSNKTETPAQSTDGGSRSTGGSRR